MDIRSTGMEFASEMVVKASLLQMKVQRGANHSVARWPQSSASPPHLA